MMTQNPSHRKMVGCRMVYSNCILYAILTGHLPKFIRNKNGRWHAIWYEGDNAYEFYAKGRSKLPYWRNIIYKGRKKLITAPEVK